jgi:hypothetical protein
MSVSDNILYWQENYWIKFFSETKDPLALARSEGGR